MEFALGKFGGGDGFAVMFDDDTAGQEILGEQKLVEWARQVAFDSTVVGDNEGGSHFVVIALKP